MSMDVTSIESPSSGIKVDFSRLPDQVDLVRGCERRMLRFEVRSWRNHERWPIIIAEKLAMKSQAVLERRVDSDVIYRNILQCGSVHDGDAFIEAAMCAMEPMMEDLVQYNMDKRRRFSVNDTLQVSIEGSDRIGIHVLSGLALEDFYRSFLEGMKRIALIVRDNPSIGIIEGVSWIWKKYPAIAERLGFTIIGNAPQRTHLPEKERERCMLAEMSREEFLKKYLKDDNPA